MDIASVYTDLTEYSRYHADLSVITATMQINNPNAGDIVTVSLFRLDGYGAVATKNITLSSATQYQIMFDLNRDVIDDKGIYRAKQGDYAILVADSNDNKIQSEMFAISIVPVSEIRNAWAKGVPFYDFEVLEPRIQPKQITGVKIIEVSADHLKGPFQLVFTAPNNLSWDNGPEITINQGLQQVILLGERQDFIMIEVDYGKLPMTSVSEMLYIDSGRIKDKAIIDQVRRATSWVQERIVTKLEPEIIDTDPKPGEFVDEVGVPETYYRPRTYNKWLSFKMPYPNILDLTVTCYFNQSKVADVPREWLMWNERTGICELVPSTAAQVIWSFYNGIFVLAYLFNYASIPGFWHFRATVGMRELWNERAIIREAIAKKTVYELLNSAGSSYRAGIASQSTARDGVSEEQSYTSSAMYGTYSGHFLGYKEWLEKEIPKIKQRFSAIQYVTI